MRKISNWVPACPRAVDWSCENCNGIAEFRRSNHLRRGFAPSGKSTEIALPVP